MKPPSNLPHNAAALLSAAVLISGFSGCSTQAVGDARATGLQNRQDRMNDRTDSRADRRQIRSDNADARSDALFNAM